MTNRFRPSFQNTRDLISKVRAQLSAAGRQDVTIDPLWVNEDQSGYPLRIDVPVGADLILPLRPSDNFTRNPSAENIQPFANELAGALINIKRAEKDLVRYTDSIRRAARREIASARAEGLDLMLDGVGLKVTYARLLTGPSWKEAATYILGTVRVGHTSVFLRRASRELIVEEPNDIAHELEDLREEQRTHQARIAELDAQDADLEVDSITLGLLSAHGIEPAQVLRDAWLGKGTNLTLAHETGEIKMSLMTADGFVRASLTIDDAEWNGDYMWFRNNAHSEEVAGLAGQSLGKLVPHAAFTSLRVAAIEHSSDGDFTKIHFDAPVHLFNASSGRIWQPDRKAA